MAQYTSTRYKTTNNLSAVDAAYIAGLIDGEGSITLTRRHKTDNRQLEISISNNDLDLLQYVLTTVGAGRIVKKKTYSKNHHAGASYIISNRQALTFLEQISPYLLTYKSRRASLVLENYLRLTPRNGKYNQELKLEREQFITRFLAIKFVATENQKAQK